MPRALRPGPAELHPRQAGCKTPPDLRKHTPKHSPKTMINKGLRASWNAKTEPNMTKGGGVGERAEGTTPSERTRAHTQVPPPRAPARAHPRAHTCAQHARVRARKPAYAGKQAPARATRAHTQCARVRAHAQRAYARKHAAPKRGGQPSRKGRGSPPPHPTTDSLRPHNGRRTHTHHTPRRGCVPTNQRSPERRAHSHHPLFTQTCE